MIGTVFRTDDVPAGDRFDYWQELVGRTRSSALVSAHAAEFWAEQRLLELGPVVVSQMSFKPTRYRRTPKLVRQSDPELYHLTLLIDGGLALDHAGRESTYTSRDLHLADSSQPYDVRSADDRQGGVVTGMAVDFPKALLPLPPHRVRELLGRNLPGREGSVRCSRTSSSAWTARPTRSSSPTRRAWARWSSTCCRHGSRNSWRRRVSCRRRRGAGQRRNESWDSSGRTSTTRNSPRP